VQCRCSSYITSRALLLPLGTNYHSHCKSQSCYREFSHQLKHSTITPLLKKPSLDKDHLSNYRPIPSLSVTSKITERIVVSHITDHLFSLLTINFISLKLSFFHFTIILSMLLDNSKLTVFVYSIGILPLTSSNPTFQIVSSAPSVDVISLNLTKVAMSFLPQSSLLRPLLFTLNTTPFS